MTQNREEVGYVYLESHSKSFSSICIGLRQMAKVNLCRVTKFSLNLSLTVLYVHTERYVVSHYFCT